jgi:hypothetical protein
VAPTARTTVATETTSPSKPSDVHEDRRERERHHDRQRHAERDAGAGQEEAVAQDESHDVASAGAERHADPDLARALRDDVRLHAVHTHDREQQRKTAKRAE